MRERLVELLNQVANDVSKFPTDNFIGSLADYLIANGVIILPYNLNLPKELYRHMFDNDKNKVVVKCKVGKNTGYNFSLIHYDGREWEYEYTSIGKFVFLTREDAERALKGDKG